MPFAIYSQPARSILSATSGFIAQAGFTHSLTPARNCTFGCTYCYVPTLGIYGGLQPHDVTHWGQQTTFKSNAAELLARAVKPGQVIYCSPLVDPFQPVVSELDPMPAILGALALRPPRVFVIQTRGSRILESLDALEALSRKTCLRVSFSITTDDDRVRHAYEPHCDPIERRFDVVQRLVERGIDSFVTLAPLLPCDPNRLLDRALAATDNPILCDPFHTRASKPRGATTRSAAERISERLGYSGWHHPAFQADIVSRMRERANADGREFETGPAAFRFLTRAPGQCDAGGSDRIE